MQWDAGGVTELVDPGWAAGFSAMHGANRKVAARKLRQRGSIVHVSSEPPNVSKNSG